MLSKKGQHGMLADQTVKLNCEGASTQQWGMLSKETNNATKDNGLKNNPRYHVFDYMYWIAWSTNKTTSQNEDQHKEYVIVTIFSGLVSGDCSKGDMPASCSSVCKYSIPSSSVICCKRNARMLRIIYSDSLHLHINSIERVSNINI